MSTEPIATVSIDALGSLLPVLVETGRAAAPQPVRRRRGWYQRAWTPLVVLWTMIYQRLHTDHTCDAAVSYVLAGGADHLDRRHAEPLSERLHSESTAGYCQGRQRLPLAWLQALLPDSGQQIASWLGADGLWFGHRVALLDGSSVLLRPTPQLCAAYASFQNQHGPTYWLGLRLLVGFCLCSGALLAAVEASIALSEQALVLAMVAQLPAGVVWVADRNFGVYSVAQAARQHQQHVVVRLNRRIAHAIAGSCIEQDGDWPVAWRCSAQAYAHPGLDGTPIPGRLLAYHMRRPGFRPLELYLFTSLTDAERYPMTALLQLYACRWHVELDLRYVKSTLDLAALAAKSPAMVRKELFAGLLGYNLIRAFMTQAALQAGVSPLTLSFTQCWRRIRDYLVRRRPTDSPATRACRTQRLLRRLANCRLPVRPAFRCEPRAVRRRPATYPKLKGDRDLARQQVRRTHAAEAKPEPTIVRVTPVAPVTNTPCIHYAEANS